MAPVKISLFANKGRLFPFQRQVRWCLALMAIAALSWCFSMVIAQENTGGSLVRKTNANVPPAVAAKSNAGDVAQPSKPIGNPPINDNAPRLIDDKNNDSRSRSGDGWLTFERCLVVAPESIEISAQETGTIGNLVVQENSPVKAMQLIGQLASDSAELEKQMAGLQHQVANAEANDESEIRLAEMVVEETKLQLEDYEAMANKGGAGSMEVRQKQIAAEQAKARWIQTRANKAQRELKAKVSQAAYLLSQKKVDKLKLVSPVHGTVVRVDHRAGEWVSAGTSILKIVKMDELRVDFFVDIEKLDPTTLMQKPVRVIASRGPSGNHTFAGVISGFAPDVSSLGKVRVHATVQNQSAGDYWMLLPGMTVTLQLAPIR